jgi:putative tryptophan/tyrosine transport system substrate-binding protein
MLDLRRREFILALGGAAAAWPLRARAQQSMRRLGILMNGAATEAGAQSYLAAFIQAFRQLGWIEGQTVRIEVRWNAGDVALAKIYAAQLIGFQPDVLLVPSTTNLTVIREATSTIPVVFLQVSDPVAQGFVASVIKPGGNLTGFSAYEFSIGSRWLDLLKQAVPDLARTAVMFNPETSPQSKFFMRSIEAAGSSLGVQVTAAPVRATIDIEPAIETFARQPNGGLILTTDSFTRLRQTFIADTASRHRLPAISGAADFAKDGGLMNYGATAYLVDDFRRAASYVDRILRGTKPSDLPVQAPTKYSLVINLKTSKALELTMPLPLLGLADEVIELLGGAAAALPLVPRVAPASEASGQRGYLINARAGPSPEPGSSARAIALPPPFGITDCYIKPYPCCRHIQPAVEALIGLLADENIASDEVERIEVATYRIAAEHAETGWDDFASAQLSFPYLIGLALKFRAIKLEHFADDVRRDPAFPAIARKLSVTAPPDVDRLYPQLRPARVTVTTARGSFTRQADEALGSRIVPLDDAALETKFLDLVGPVLGTARAKALAEQLWSVDAISDVAPLVESMAKPG